MNLPPYSLLHGDCPNCKCKSNTDVYGNAFGQQPTWYEVDIKIWNEKDYDVPIYQETIMCGLCRWRYKCLRPCLPQEPTNE